MKKKIGLALSGGGINGIAHLELIKRLESEGIMPGILAGSSAGAIIAVLYADGGVKKIVRFFDELEEQKIFFSRQILTRGPGVAFKRVDALLRTILKAKTFAGLKIPFACVATDLLTGEPEVMTSGDLVSAVMASSAVPGVFHPRLIGKKYLADGGISDGLPFGPVRYLGGDFVIGSILNNFRDVTMEEAEGFSRIATLNRAVEIIRHHEHQRQVECCDFCFDFPTADIPSYSFHAKDSSIKIAKKCLDDQVPKLIKALKKLEILS